MPSTSSSSLGMGVKKKEARIYWEKQTLALCGHHALNALLQGPFVTTGELQKIAETLDEEERKLLTSEKDRRQFDATPSENVDATTGNYSLQVLDRALRERFKKEGLKLVPVFKRSELNEAAKNKAFLINARQHWYAMRDIRGQWWNLNSQLAAPAKVNGEIIWYLENMIQSGMHVFAVEGALPQAHEIFGQKDGEYGNWIAESECEETNEMTAKAEREGKTLEQVKKEMKEEKKRKMIFSGKANTLRGDSTTTTMSERERDNLNDGAAIEIDDADIGVDRNEDPELYAAIKASLEEEARKRKNNNTSSLGSKVHQTTTGEQSVEPEESPDTLSVAVRMPDGVRLKPRRFLKNDSIEDVENWVARASNNAVAFKSRGGDKSLVLVHFPKRTTLDDPRKTLEQCGFETREMLTLA